MTQPVLTLKDPTEKLNVFSSIRYVLPDYPRQVKVETSSLCSAACPWCHLHGREGDTREKRNMDFGLFEQVLEDLASWEEPLKELVPTNFGELFMNKDWFRLLMAISDRLPQTEIALVTTGILLHEEAIEQLALVPTLAYVNFSLNAFFSETWARQHQRPAKLMSRAVQAVHLFRDRRPDVRVNVSMVYDTQIVSEVERDLFEAYWMPFGPVSVSHRSSAGWPGRGPKEPVVLPCRSIFDGLTVFDDGSAGVACCFDGLKEASLNVGHVPEDRLLDIWRGQKLAKITDLHNAGRRAELPLCKQCTFA